MIGISQDFLYTREGLVTAALIYSVSLFMAHHFLVGRVDGFSLVAFGIHSIVFLVLATDKTWIGHVTHLQTLSAWVIIGAVSMQAPFFQILAAIPTAVVQAAYKSGYLLGQAIG